MKTTLVYSYFSSLTPKEVSLFGKYLRSPYYNEGKMLLKLYDELKRIFEKSSSKEKEVSKELVYKKVYNDNNFNRAKFNQLCSEMTKHLENFIALLESENNKGEYYLNLLRGFEKRERFTEFDMIMNKVEQTYTRDFGTVADYYEIKTKAELIKHNSLSYRSSADCTPRFSVLNTYSDLFVLEHKLYIACSVILERFVRPVDYEENFDLMKILVEHVLNKKESFIENNPVIYLQALFLDLMFNQNEKQLDNFIDELNHRYDELTFKEVNYFFEYGFVYLHSRSLRDFEFNYNAFYFLSKFEKKGLFKGHSRIDREKFIAYCYIGINTHNINWCLTFLQNYKHLLYKEFRPQAENLILGLCLFEQKDYEKAIEKLSLIKKPDKFIASRIKAVLLLSFYELGYEDEMYNSIDNLKNYFKKINANDTNRFYLLLKFFLEYLKMRKEESNTKAVEKVIKEIKSYNQVAYKYWLLEKYSDLIQINSKAHLQN